VPYTPCPVYFPPPNSPSYLEPSARDARGAQRMRVRVCGGYQRRDSKVPWKNLDTGSVKARVKHTRAWSDGGPHDGDMIAVPI
jgi:hypothetical protein